MADRIYRQKMQEMSGGATNTPAQGTSPDMRLTLIVTRTENDENRPALQSLTKKQAASSVRKGTIATTQSRGTSNGRFTVLMSFI